MTARKSARRATKLGQQCDKIAERLDAASPAQIERWAKGDLSVVAEAPPPPAPAAPAYPAARCEMVEVAPGLTILLRADCDPAVRQMAAEIYARFGPARRG